MFSIFNDSYLQSDCPLPTGTTKVRMLAYVTKLVETVVYVYQIEQITIAPLYSYARMYTYRSIRIVD